MTQPADLQKGLVRVLTDGGEARRVVGAGFLVSPCHVLTCAHVVADALGIPGDAPAAPTAPVWLDWPLVAGSAPMTAQVTRWHPVKAEAKRGELEDIAVLELDGERPLPDAAQPVPVVVVEDHALFDRPVRMYGFAEDRGDWVNGQLQGPVATGWVQLDHELGRLCVAPGFSGTAVWDKRENAAVGMIVSIATRESVRSAYMIPAASLIRAWPALDAHSRPPNPYRGLEAFREQDARYFMGRDRDAQDLLAMLQQRPFVAVVGASGSGKSSLLFAGVVPQLRQQENWLIADFRPRGDPFRELATALTLLLYPDLDELERLEKRKQLADKLSERSLNLVDVVDLLIRSYPGKRLLLIADQFEELYTQNLAPERQRQFVDELAAAMRAQAKKPAFTLLLAMRVDFLGQALDYEPLAEWIKPNHLLLGPLGQAGLEAAIESPAQQLGVKLEEGLAERILQDLGQEPGALSLLEFALTQLWERQQYRQLTHAAYKAIGGVTQALAQYADGTLTRFPGEQERLRRVFVQLVRPGEGAEDTRQVATREQVGADNWNLVTELADERLVVTGRDAQGQETVEVVHEALLRYWQPLRQWIEQDRQFRVWQNRLRLAVQEWEKNNQDEGALLRGARLAEAEERLSGHAEELSRAEKEYIKASIASRERDAILRQRGRRRVITGLTVGLVATLILSGLVTWQWWGAENQRNQALARQLAAQAGLSLKDTGESLILSALLATESLSRFHTLEGYLAWAGAIELLPQPMVDLPHAGWVIALAFNPSGSHLATASADGKIQLWDITTAKETAHLFYEDWVTALALSPDNNRLAIASSNKIVRIINIFTGKELINLPQKQSVIAAAFNADGTRLATASGNNITYIWDTYNGKELKRLFVEDGAKAVAFNSDGTLLVTAFDYKTTHIWNAHTGQEITRLASEAYLNPVHRSKTKLLPPSNLSLAPAGEDLFDEIHLGVLAVSFSNNINQLITSDTEDIVRLQLYKSTKNKTRIASYTGFGNVTRIWNPATGKELTRLLHKKRGVTAVALNVDGSLLATAGTDNKVRLWISDIKQVRLNHEDEVTSLVFSPSGNRLATAGIDKTVRIWDMTNGKELARLNHEVRIKPMAFNLDENHLIIAKGKTTFIWDMVTGKEISHLPPENMASTPIFSPDHSRLAITSKDGAVHILSMITGKEVARLSLQAGARVAAISPDGIYLAITRKDKKLCIWSTTSKKEIACLHHEDYVTSATFSPNNNQLATASQDGTARIWNAANGEELVRLNLEKVLNNLAFSPAGNHLVTASQDGTARIWDPANGKELARINHENEVLAVAFSPDGRRLATASADKTVKISLWQTKDLITEACKRLPRNLTRQEWRQYVGEEVPYHATCPNLPAPED